MASLSEQSRFRLQRVHPDLVAVVERAIAITPVDFFVIEGWRTIERQRELVARGHSHTMHSRHLTGHAVDLGAWVDDAVSWEWRYYYTIARTMQRAAAELSTEVQWGGCWQLLSSISDPEEAVEEYVGRRAAQGRPVFTDGPHFALPRDLYPA